MHAGAYQKNFVARILIKATLSKPFNDHDRANKTFKVESFNNHYINIVEQSSGLKPAALGQKGLGDKAEICSIIESYKNHPSVKQISSNLKLLEKEEKFCFKMVTTKYIKSLLQKRNTKKPVGIDSTLQYNQYNHYSIISN